MKRLILNLAWLLAPAVSSAVVVYTHSPPTLERLAHEAQRIVVARVMIDSLASTSAWPCASIDSARR